MKLLTRERLGNRQPNELPDIQLYIPHGATVETFQAQFSELYQQLIQAIPEDEETIRSFWTLEGDEFSSQLAKKISTKVYEILRPNYPEVSVEVVTVDVLRAIADVNRLISIAICNTFDFSRHSALHHDLKVLHSETLYQLQRVLGAKHVSREIHTMSPLVPNREVIVTPDTIRDRLDAWSMNSGEILATDLICKLEGSTTISVGDPTSVLNLKERLEAYGFPVGLSERYRANFNFMSPQLATTLLTKNHVILDATKNQGSKQQPGDDDFLLWRLDYDDDRLEHFALPIALSIVDDFLRSSEE